MRNTFGEHVLPRPVDPTSLQTGRPGWPWLPTRGCGKALALFFLMSSAFSTAMSQDLTTSFEFFDLDGEFTLGTAPKRVVFINGEANRVGILRLYHSGLFSWMIDVGTTGRIWFETPARQVNLFLRDQNALVASILGVFDENLQIISTFPGNAADWTHVSLNIDPGSPPIRLITLRNPAGTDGDAVIDDFSFSVVPDDGPIADPIPGPIPQSFLPIRLVPVATGLTAPNWGTFAPGAPFRLFVTDQNGILWSINLLNGQKTVFLDVSARLVELGIAGPDSFDERGLLGVAFHPGYQSNGLLYTYTSEPVSGPADFSTMPPGINANHHSVIIEWNVPNPANPGSVVDPVSARELMRIDEPQFNHDGGGLNFGPDGMMFISLGDGGGADDVDGELFQGEVMVGHGQGNGQDLSNVLGKLLRIDPTGSDSTNGQYGVPVDNPFVGQPGAVPEIYAYGLRNPFRFSFDRLNGDLYVADVGQNDIEEIDVITAGGNFGWNLKEGSFFFNPNGNDLGFVTNIDPGVPPGLIDPIAEYDHDEGIAVIGGFLYRGLAIPYLRGRYVFGDFAKTFNNDGRLFMLDLGRTLLELRQVGGLSLNRSLLGFGQDAFGELYVMVNDTGTPFGNTGTVLKIRPFWAQP